MHLFADADEVMDALTRLPEWNEEETKQEEQADLEKRSDSLSRVRRIYQERLHMRCGILPRGERHPGERDSLGYSGGVGDDQHGSLDDYQWDGTLISGNSRTKRTSGHRPAVRGRSYRLDSKPRRFNSDPF